MKLVWWQAAIIASIIFVAGIFALWKFLNGLLLTSSTLFDVGYLAEATLISFLGVNIITFFITKSKKLYAFIALWFITNILVVKLFYFNVPFPVYHYLPPVAFLQILSGLRLPSW